jgi:hypothetical protein
VEFEVGLPGKNGYQALLLFLYAVSDNTVFINTKLLE